MPRHKVMKIAWVCVGSQLPTAKGYFQRRYQIGLNRNANVAPDFLNILVSARWMFEKSNESFSLGMA